MRTSSCIVLCVVTLASLARAAAPASAPAGYGRWQHGPSTNPAFFPIAVWLQEPSLANRYQQAGINVFVGLWQGPTEKQLADLKAAGMPVICEQNDVGLKHLDDPTIIAWMHGDEPDNAQSLPGGKGYGPPVLPDKIIADYKRIAAADPTRPVMLNLGQGVAWDGWYGRGVRTNHPEDYAQYLKGCDIASFDIYPVVSDSKVVQGNLWYVALGVERLLTWSGGQKPVWNCIECTHIQSTRKATPDQVRAEVWMSLVHGSRGIIYFVHEWVPKLDVHALLDDPQMLAAVTSINQQIRDLAPVLNSPTLTNGPTVVSSVAAAPIVAMSKQYAGYTYIFAVELKESPSKATFTAHGVMETIEVIGEGRKLDMHRGQFEDDFGPHAVHLYRIRNKS